MASLNSKCPEFKGWLFGCTYFIPSGACKRPDKFMCQVWIDTRKQPVEDDIPLHIKTVLEHDTSARVISHKEGEKGKEKNKDIGIESLKDILGAKY